MASKTLIVGGATGYDWDKLKYWVNSINDSGFQGDVAIVATDITNETITKLNENGVNVSGYGKKTDKGFERGPARHAPHVERFFWISNYIKTNGKNYDHVIVTDVRDVIFQDNPDTFLRQVTQVRPILASSECVLIKDEPWNKQNVIETFGPFFAEPLMDAYILNVGVIAGRKSYVEDLLLMIFQMSLNRPIPIVDQAVYNFLINREPYRSDTYRADNVDGWAAQMGVTEKAFEAGEGDIGKMLTREQYDKIYRHKQPKIQSDLVFNEEKPFVIVHQWDRVPALKEIVERKYGA